MTGHGEGLGLALDMIGFVTEDRNTEAKGVLYVKYTTT